MSTYQLNIDTPGLKYAWEWQHNRYLKFWDYPVAIKSPADPVVVKNGYVLPCLRDGKFMWGSGGVIDSNFKPVSQSWMHPHMQGSWQFESQKCKKLSGEYIYLGLLLNHWGHFIVDTCSRLYMMRKHPDAKFIFITFYRREIPDFFPAITRVFEILGVQCANNILIIENPTQVENLIVPDRAYIKGVSVSEEYLELFRFIADHIIPTSDNKWDKIFLSRSSWNLHTGKEIGADRIEKYFNSIGYHSIIPEDLLLDDQIYLLSNAEKIACIESSVIHNLIFSQGRKKELYMIKKYHMIASAMLDSCRFSNTKIHFCDFYASKYPVSSGIGPFLLTPNDNFKRFVNDTCKYDQEITEYAFQPTEVADYLHLFKELNQQININANASNDPSSPCYFDPYLIYDWHKNYYRYEDGSTGTQPLAIATTKPTLMTSTGDKESTFIKKRGTMACQAHLSTIGWMPTVDFGEICGKPGEGYFIQAIRITSDEYADSIFYQVKTRKTGWSGIASNGAICGTTGKSLNIDGLRIWADERYIPRLECRIYSTDWSDWQQGKCEFMDPNGIQAIEVRLAPKEIAEPMSKKNECSSNLLAGAAISNSASRINRLASLRDGLTYLEIGVKRGSTFFKVDMKSKTGVDPMFAFDISNYANKANIHLFQETSDKFFAAYHNLCLCEYGKELKFDIIFIDGLHTFEQAMRDFINSLSCSTQKTIWIFDDTIPSDPWSAIPNQQRSYALRKLAGLKDSPWHGDVFKCVATIHDLMPTFSYATVVDSGNPQTVVWRTDQLAQRDSVFGGSAGIAALNYFSIMDKIKYLNPIFESELDSMIGSVLHDSQIGDKIGIEQIIKPLFESHAK